jgi:3',5'-cyclic-AMP phosphodiesterase
MSRITGLLIGMAAFIFSGCGKFDYSPYETDKITKRIEVTNSFNIERLLKLPPKDTLHLVLLGDTQRFYDELKDLVNAVNSLSSVDAVIITGDIADFGAAREYEWINDELIRLNVPFLTVIGNHDHLANAIDIYQDIYGPLNYSFTWNNIRFVMHNTNGREFGFNGNVPDLMWMQQQLSDTANYQSCVFVSHVPPNDMDFDASLEAGYVKVLRESKNIIFSSNGHRHNYYVSQIYNDGIWYLNTSSPLHRTFSFVTIYDSLNEKIFTCTPVTF